MPAATNGTRKTAPNSGSFRKGVDSRRGGGKPGRSGRKPDDFKQACAALADNEVLSTVRAYLRSKKPSADDPWFWKCAEYVTNYGKGKPAQSVIVGQDDDAPPFRFTMNLGEAAIHEGDDE